MPHLYTHVRHGSDFIQDTEGQDFDSLEAARADALAAAREIMSERVKQGQPADGSRFEIADEHGKILCILPFHEALSE